MRWRNIGKAIAGQMESTARTRARENRNTPLGEEYSRFADGMNAFKNSELLNPESDDEGDDKW